MNHSVAPWRTIAVIGGVLVCRLAASDQAPSSTSEPDGVRRALIVCGHPGDDDHRKLFAETVEKLQRGLSERYGFSTGEVRVLFGGQVAQGEGPVLSGVRGQATRDELEAQAGELRKVLSPRDTLWVIVMGHAHYDGRNAFLNLPGPDLNQREFAKLFDGLAAREQVFFITTPVSGFSLKPLSARRRVVITATEADLEVNETLCPLALAEVLSQPAAPADFDADGDGRLTLFDLYIALARNVAQRYVADEALSTEHAQLDDNGDGRGSELQLDYLTPEQGGRLAAGKIPPKIKEGADGSLAAQIVLPESAAAPTAAKAAEKN